MDDDTQEQRIALLEQQLSALRGSKPEIGVITNLGMPEKQATILAILVKRFPAVISRETFHSVIYGDRSDGGPEPAIFDVWVCRIRKTLRREGCPGTVETVWGSGYRASEGLVEWVNDLYKKNGI